MNKLDYSRIWKSLDKDADTVDSPGVLKRLVDPAVSPELHLAITVPDKERVLLVRMPSDWSGDISIYPRWRGASIYAQVGDERPERSAFLVIRQGKDSAKEVFEALIADVCDTIVSQPGSDVGEIISQRLECWRIFFEDQRQEGLSPEAQQGLFGELLFMREHLFPVLGMNASVRSWAGSKRASRDFQFGRTAIEMKTSSAKQHHRIIIANEKQLDTVGLDGLGLVFMSLDVSEQGEDNLPNLIARIMKDLQLSHEALAEFRDKLLEAGYLEIHDSLYYRSYIPRDLLFYRVAEGFPRILEKNLMNGVGDVSYSVMLSACDRFRMPVQKGIAWIAGSNLGSHVE